VEATVSDPAMIARTLSETAVGMDGFFESNPSSSVYFEYKYAPLYKDRTRDTHKMIVQVLGFGAFLNPSACPATCKRLHTKATIICSRYNTQQVKCPWSMCHYRIQPASKWINAKKFSRQNGVLDVILDDFPDASAVAPIVHQIKTSSETSIGMMRYI
jgi:hypothetical protein